MEPLHALARFVQDLAQDQHGPQRKFIHDILFGILAGQSLIIADVVRSLNEPIEPGATEKRLSRNLNSDRLDEGRLHARYLEMLSPHLKVNNGAGVVIGIDYTDIIREYGDLREGRGSEALRRCWNGSDGHTTPGYPIVQFEAVLPSRVSLPLAYQVFSVDEPDHMSQPMEFMKAATMLRPYLGDETYWCFDRAFITKRWTDTLDGLDVRHWVGRLKISTEDRKNKAEITLVTAKGEFKKVHEIADGLESRFSYEYEPTKRQRKHRKTIRIDVCHCKVWLAHGPQGGVPKRKWGKHGPVRTLIVLHGFGKAPMVLLANGWLRTKKQIMRAIRVYRRRWLATEESTRGMKDRFGWGVGLETVRALKLRGVKRMIMLASFVYGFMGLLRIHAPKLVTKLAKAARAMGGEPADPRYRILRGLSDKLGRVYRKVFERWRKKVAILEA